MTGYYKTLVRPRQHHPLSMLKYDPVGTSDYLSLHFHPQSEKDCSHPIAAGAVEGDLCSQREVESMVLVSLGDADFPRLQGSLKRKEKKKKRKKKEKKNGTLTERPLYIQ